MKAGRYVLALAALVGIACNDAAGPSSRDAVVGSWASVGADVAPGLVAAYKATSVVAKFGGDSRYTITLTDSSGVQSISSGTWIATGAPGTLGTIELHQTSPSVERWSGLLQVDGARLTYEVIRTAPVVTGFTAPTVSGGFGSTAQDGAASSSDWIQRFIVASVLDSSGCVDEPTVTAKRPCMPSSWNPAEGKR